MSNHYLDDEGKLWDRKPGENYCSFVICKKCGKILLNHGIYIDQKLHRDYCRDCFFQTDPTLYLCLRCGEFFTDKATHDRLVRENPDIFFKECIEDSKTG
ncbi:MAG: hypothetical protein ACFFD4_02260 [Candidatus Odinarchaeota archaeon]